MSFKGVVTQKEKEGGVTVLAKIVSANKKKSLKAKYDVVVAANAMSDDNACAKDLIERISALNKQGLTDLLVDLPFAPIGTYGSTLKYEIDSTSALSKHLSPNGTLMSYPKFGEGDATGRIKITSIKGDAKSEGFVNVTIKAYDAERIFDEYLSGTEAEKLNKFWKTMTNDPTTPYTLNSGALTMRKTWTPWANLKDKPSVYPFTIVSYTFTDNASSTLGVTRFSDVNESLNNYSDSTTPVQKKNVNAISYTDLSTAKSNLSLLGMPLETKVNDNDAGQIQLKYGGLKLVVKLELRDETGTARASRTLTYKEIFTLSKPLTNQEVLSYFESDTHKTEYNNIVSNRLIQSYTLTGASFKSGYVIGDGALSSIIDPEAVQEIDCSDANIVRDGKVQINVLIATSMNRQSIPELGIKQGEMNAKLPFDIGDNVHAFANDKEPYAFAEYLIYSTVSNSNNADGILEINLQAIKDACESVHDPAINFSIVQTLTIANFGDRSDQKTMELRKQIILKNLDILAGTISDSESHDAGE